MTLNFSKHALDRVYERLNLSKQDIIQLLVNDICMPLGEEAGTNRIHKLFYSYPDDCCFVSVQDKKDGTIITVLPVDYHNKWKVSYEAQTAAKNLALGITSPSAVIKNKEQRTFKIGVYLENSKKKNLGSTSSDKYTNPRDLAKDKSFIPLLLTKLSDRFTSLESIECIGIKFGKNGEEIFFDFTYRDGQYSIKENTI